MGTEKDNVYIVFPVEPRPKERARVAFIGGRARAYTPTKTRSYESEIKRIAQGQYREKPLEKALAVELKFYLTRPKSVRRPLHTVKPDLSNMVKAIEDACNGVVWKDDSQIISLTCSKEYAIVPKIEMFVSEVSEYGSVPQKK